NPELGFPTWCLVELLSQPRHTLPCTGRRHFSALLLIRRLNLLGTKGSVPDPARSCREKLPCKRCLSLCSAPLRSAL
ncbi:hypothetical protein N321_09847, partial [Antrostomus carolinensis]